LFNCDINELLAIDSGNLSFNVEIEPFELIDRFISRLEELNASFEEEEEEDEGELLVELALEFV